MVRYYGWYSNKSRGLRLKRGVVRLGDEPLGNDSEIEIIDVSEYEPKRIPSKTWRECIKKIWEVDPLEWEPLYENIEVAREPFDDGWGQYDKYSTPSYIA